MASFNSLPSWLFPKLNLFFLRSQNFPFEKFFPTGIKTYLLQKVVTFLCKKEQRYELKKKIGNINQSCQRWFNAMNYSDINFPSRLYNFGSCKQRATTWPDLFDAKSYGPKEIQSKMGKKKSLSVCGRKFLWSDGAPDGSDIGRQMEKCVTDETDGIRHH